MFLMADSRFILYGGLSDLYSKSFYSKIAFLKLLKKTFVIKLFFTFFIYCCFSRGVKGTCFELRYPFPFSETWIVSSNFRNAK